MPKVGDDDDDVEAVDVFRQAEARPLLEQTLVGGVVHAEDEPLHEQHIEDDEIRRAKNVRGREHEKRDDRGVLRGHDVEEEVGDRACREGRAGCARGSAGQTWAA